jgi:hypothetical protein
MYLLSFSGVPISDDEQLYASGARNLAVLGRLSAEQLYGNLRLKGQYHGVEPAFPVVASLWYRLFWRSGFGHLQSLYLLPIFFAGSSVALLVLIASQLGFSNATGTLAGLVFGLGTIAWPYAKTFFREWQIVLLLLASLALFLHVILSSPPSWRSALGGILLIMLLTILTLTKVTMAVTALLLLATVPFLKPGALELRRRLTRLTLGCTLVAVAVLIYSASYKTTDQSVLYRFTGTFLQDALSRLTSIPHSHLGEALFAPLISPWKGIFIYSPVCLVAFLSFAKYGRTRQELFILPFGILISLCLTQALAYDDEWWTPPWASRFLLPAMPLLIIASLPVLEQMTRPTRFGLFLRGLGAVGFVIQLPAVLFNSAEFTATMNNASRSTFPAAYIWNFSRLPMIAQWQAIGSGPPDLLLWRTAADSPALASIIIVGGLGLIVTFAFWLSRSLTTSLANNPEFRRPPVVLLAALPVLALLVLKLAGLDTAYKSPELASICMFMRHHLRAGQAVVVQPYPGPIWQYLMNSECGQRTWYSLPYDQDIAANPETRQLTRDLLGKKLPVGAGYWWIRQFWAGSLAPTASELAGDRFELASEYYFYDPLGISISFYRSKP